MQSSVGARSTFQYVHDIHNALFKSAISLRNDRTRAHEDHVECHIEEQHDNLKRCIALFPLQIPCDELGHSILAILGRRATQIRRNPPNGRQKNPQKDAPNRPTTAAGWISLKSDKMFNITFPRSLGEDWYYIVYILVQGTLYDRNKKKTLE